MTPVEILISYYTWVLPPPLPLPGLPGGTLYLLCKLMKWRLVAPSAVVVAMGMQLGSLR